MIWPGSLLAVFAADAIFLALSAHSAVLPEDDLDEKTRLDVELKSFTNCDNYPSMPMMFNELQIAQVAKKKFAVNGAVDMNMTVTNGLMASVTIMECADSTSDDTCEFVGTVRGTKFCDKISKQGSPWFKFVKDTEIGNKCPVNPGSYVLKEAPLEFEDAEGMPLTPGHWKLQMELYNEAFEGDPIALGKEPFGCNVVEVTVTPSRESLPK